MFPSGSDNGPSDGGADFGFASTTSSARKTFLQPGTVSIEGIESGIQDLGFDFDENGNLIETAPRPAVSQTPSVPAAVVPLGSDLPGHASATADRSRRDHEEALQTPQKTVRVGSS